MTLAERLVGVRAAPRSPASGSSRTSMTTRSPRSPALCRDQGWSLATWDIDRGLASPAGPTGRAPSPAAADPLAAIRSLAALATPDGTALLVLRNFHRFLGSAEVVQAARLPARRRQAGPDLRRRPVAGRPDPRRAGEALRRRRARPARPRPARGHRPRRSPPSRASCPRATASTPCSTRRPG